MASPDSSDMSIYLTTFNMNMRSAKLSDDELRRWIAPAFAKFDDPELFVVGVQELLPLELALAGWGHGTLASLASRIGAALGDAAHDTQRAEYTLAFSALSGGVALLVFARGDTASCMSRPVVARVALGDVGLSNKAAVGVRVAIDRRGGDMSGEPAWESFTFISAHLSAHDHNLARRNAECRTIASSLLFPPASPLALPQTLYDSSHAFVMGDLNYRLARTPPGGHDLSVERLELDDDTHDHDALREERTALVALDTLKQAQAQGDAFAGMDEGDLAAFAPTYKRVIGQRAGYSAKRIPGYTDRILWASVASGQGARTEAYASVDEVTLSDHKPIGCRIVLPPSATGPGTGTSPHHTSALTLAAPATRTDATFLTLYAAWGLAADRTVGYAWLLTLLLGGGRLKIGLGVEAVLLLGVAGYASGLLRL